MADWTHCNACFRQPGSGSPAAFLLTGCGHIFCTPCIRRQRTSTPRSGGSQHECLVCKRKASVVEINRQLTEDVRLYFTDPKAVLMQQVKQMIEVVEFQNKQRARINAYQRERLAKVDKMVAYFQREMKKKMENEQELKALKVERHQLRAQVEAMRRLIGEMRANPNGRVKTPRLENTYRERRDSPASVMTSGRSPANNPLLMSFEAGATPRTSLGSSAGRPRPLVRASPADSEMTTPKMLGMARKQQQMSASRRTAERKPFMAEPMETDAFAAAHKNTPSFFSNDSYAI